MDLINKSYHFSCGKSSEKIIVVLFTVSFVFSHIADSMKTPELENKEFKVSFFGHKCDFC